MDESLKNSIINGNLEEIINSGFDFQKNNKLIFRVSSSYGHLHIIKYLIDLGINPNLDRLLFFAIDGNHLDIVTYLVSKGADIHAVYVIHQAIRKGHLDIARYLIENGADINTIALYTAARYGHLEIVRYLVEYGVRIQRNTLIASIYHNRISIIKFLMENGADIEDIFEISAGYGNLEIVKMAMDFNNLDRIFNGGFALRDSAKNGHLHVVQYLVEKGFYIHYLCDDALAQCAISGCFDVVKYLIKNKLKDHVYHNLLLININKAPLEIIQYVAEKCYHIHEDKYNILKTSILLKKDNIIDFLLPICSRELIKELLFSNRRRKEMFQFLKKRDISKYPILIEIYREFGEDVFDMLEKES